MKVQEGKIHRAIVLVPFPLQGHITPMLQLGAVLHSKGFSIIIAHAEFNPPNPSDHPEFTFLSIRENLSHLDKTFENTLIYISELNIHSKVPLIERLSHVIYKTERCDKISCIIYDPLMYFSEAVAIHLKLPSIILFTSSGSSLLTYRILPQLQQKGYIPLSDYLLQEPVPELQPFRFKDLPLFYGTFPPELFRHIISKRTSSAFILNTMDYLEPSSLSAHLHHYQIPFFSIGPLHKMASSSPTSLLKEDPSCMAWLDKQPPNSVIYVSLGSMVTVDEKELVETAWGLVNSFQPFLWVIRFNLAEGSKWNDLFPEELKEKIANRGCIVEWAPQKEVLAHNSVGGFWSHCGWNSTLESIAEGVPMICRPSFADQSVNTRYITHVWRIGLEIEDVLKRQGIERAIRKLMVDSEGEEMRQKAIAMKQKAAACLEKGGSTYNSLNELADFISSF